jgi:hypothetical protein
MSVFFRDLDATRDWWTLVEELGLTAASAMVSWNPAAVYRGVRDAITRSAPNPGIDERAGVWLRVTATSALLSLLDDPRFGGPLAGNDARKDAARTFIAELLSLKGFDRLDQSVVVNPAGAPVMAEVIAQLPRLVREGADPGVDDSVIAARYAELLRSTSARVHALDTGFYAPLVAALDSRFSVGVARDLAWAAHANWIVSLYREEAIFSPDQTETIPLAATYHRLRCYWHEQEEDDDPDDLLTQPRKPSEPPSSTTCTARCTGGSTGRRPATRSASSPAGREAASRRSRAPSRAR